MIEGPFSVKEGHFVDYFKKMFKDDIKFISELEDRNFFLKDFISGGSRPLIMRMFNENYRKDLEEILWE